MSGYLPAGAVILRLASFAFLKEAAEKFGNGLKVFLGFVLCVFAVIAIVGFSFCSCCGCLSSCFLVLMLSFVVEADDGAQSSF